MGGTSKQEQTSTQQSQLTPWSNASPGLSGILSGLNPSINNLNGTPQTDQAFNSLMTNAQGQNPYGDPSQSAALSQLGGGGNYGAATNALTDAYGRATSALSPYASGDAYNSPAFQQMRQTVQQDVGNTVNPMFSAAGRLGSPDNYQALARGITQGETPLLQGAANNQIQAGGMLGSLGTSTAGGLTSADLARAGIQGQGIGNAATAYSAQNLGPQALLQAALGKMQLPIQNAGALTGILGPLAAQFGQQTGSGTQSGYSTMSPVQQFAMLGQGFNSFMNPFKTPAPPTMPG